jgi:hypothetical protein
MSCCWSAIATVHIKQFVGGHAILSVIEANALIFFVGRSFDVQ